MEMVKSIRSIRSHKKNLILKEKKENLLVANRPWKKLKNIQIVNIRGTTSFRPLMPTFQKN